MAFSGLQETEGDADITEAVRFAVVFLEIVAGEFSAPDKVIVATERKFNLESIRLRLDLDKTAGFP